MAFLAASFDRAPKRLTLIGKLGQVSWLMVFLILALGAVGIAMLYSAAGGHWSPWAERHAMRLGVALIMMLGIAVFDIRVWFRLAYPIYFGVFVLVIAVEFVGAQSMGAQRWIDLGFFQLQPSELMKIALILALARYFHGISVEDVGQFGYLLAPLAMIAAPALFVLRQPDLGTASMLVLIGGCVFFLAGVRLWVFGAALGAVLVALPVGWSLLHTYQRKRIFTFLDPEKDPLGAGYHILQSKIALGSGGVLGKGFLKGTQSHLNFLPEKQTDFIFTMFAEETGLAGGLALIALFLLLIGVTAILSVRVRSQFGRLLTMGVAATVFIYLFINIAMVMGLIPIVGVPLPLISYGGTSMLSLMIGFGLALSATVHRESHISRHGAGDG